MPITANSEKQIKDSLWPEIASWYRRLPDWLKDSLEVAAERITVKACPDQAFAVPRTASKDNPEALQGFHSDHLMFVIDEASGIDDIVFEVAQGALSGGNILVLMTGNPTRTSGYFYDAFHKNRAEWSTYHVPCSASSRVSPEYAEKMAREYGEHSNVYRVRVLGEFPLSEDDSVIALGLIEAAIGREVVAAETQVVWGLDVARYGDDDTALAKRRGNVLLEPVKSWKKLDLMQTAGKVYQEWRETPAESRPNAINVDVIGIGAGVVDRLRELGAPVRGINVGEAPATDAARFMRLRDELWFKARDWFQARDCKLPRDDGLIAQLVQPKYKITSAGKLQVESKDEMKKRGIKSPDKADAFCLTLAGGDYAVSRFRQALSEYDPFAPLTEARQPAWRERSGGEDYRPW